MEVDPKEVTNACIGSVLAGEVIKVAEGKYPREKPVKVPRLYVAVDIETKGVSLDHETIQIGWAWGTKLDDIQCSHVCIKSTKPFEQRCLDEFWNANDENKATLKRIEKEAVDAYSAWVLFAQTLDSFKRMSDDVRILSDNPSFDIARIDYDLFTRVGEDGKRLCEFGMRRACNDEYYKIGDPSAMIKGLPKATRTEITSRLTKEFPHTHWAPNDAAHILAMHFLVQEAVAKQESG